MIVTVGHLQYWDSPTTMPPAFACQCRASPVIRRRHHAPGQGASRER